MVPHCEAMLFFIHEKKISTFHKKKTEPSQRKQKKLFRPLISLCFFFSYVLRKKRCVSEGIQAAYSCLLAKRRKTIISTKAVNARKGIVTNPPQLIYCMLQGTPEAQGGAGAHCGNFCIP